MRIRVKLTFLLLTLSLLPLVILGVIVYRHGERALKDSFGVSLQLIAEEAVEKIDRSLYHFYHDGQMWAGLERMQEVATGDLDGRIALFLLGVHQSYGSFSRIDVVNREGVVIASSAPEVISRQARQGPFYADLLSGKPHLGDVHFDEESQAWIVTLAFPIQAQFEKDTVIGVLVLKWNAETLSGLLRPRAGRVSLPLQRRLTLLRHDGLVIATSDADKQEVFIRNIRAGGSRAAELANQGRDGYLLERDERQRMSLIGYASSEGYRDFPGFRWGVLVSEDVKITFAPVERLRVIVITIAVGVAFGVSVVALLLAQRVTRPIMRITRIAARIAQGHFEDRISYASGDEVGSLAQAFDHMTEQLQRTMVSRDALLREVAERRQAEEALERHAAELARSNSELEQFAYVTSHHLQEPLRTVASYVQLLAQRYRSQLGSDADAYIAYAVGGAHRMKTLLNDLLEYSRVGTRGTPFHLTSCQVAWEEVLTSLQATIQDSGAVVTCDPLPSLMADPAQLTQVFQHLLSNAIKFRRKDTPPRIHVSAERQDHVWLLSVRDNGMGIDPQYAERIFLIFQRLHTEQEYPGMGSSLAICKKIVERHGGRIWVESQLGQGATFRFTIPTAEGIAEAKRA